MCSRYNLTSSPEAVQAAFGLAEIEPFPPRYNIAPGQPVVIVRHSHRGTREAHLVRWGLVPGWWKDTRRLPTLFTARAETAHEKASFKGGLRHRRCLVPANGFYEWSGPPRARMPHLLGRADGGPMAFGAVAEHWLAQDGSELESMAIVTVPADASVAPFNDRMPLIVPPAHYADWLDCRSGDGAPANALLAAPAAAGGLACRPVSPRLNSAHNEGRDLIEPDQPRLL